MSAKHTPGPWKIVGNAYGLPCIYNADLTECVTDRVFNGNENILQAAPELLQALQELVDEFDRYDKAMAARFGAGHEDYGMQRAIARAAIAKATAAK